MNKEGKNPETHGMWERFVEWADKNLTVKNIFLMFGGIIGLLLLIFLAIKVLQSIITFIVANSSFFIMLFGAIMAVLWYLMDRSSKREKYMCQTPVCNTENSYYIDDMTLDYNYNVLQNMLFQIIPEISVTTNLKPPTMLSELLTSERWHINADFNVPLFHFTCAKTGEVDTANTKDALQRRINQKLEANEINGLTSTSSHVCAGTVLPRIIVDNVYSSGGSFVELMLVFTDDSYFRLLQKRHSIHGARTSGEVSGRDRDV